MVATAVLAAAVLHKTRHDEVAWAESGRAESGATTCTGSAAYQLDPAAALQVGPAARSSPAWSVGIGLSVIAFMGAMR